MLELVPISLAEANAFVKRHHRHHKPGAVQKLENRRGYVQVVGRRGMNGGGGIMPMDKKRYPMHWQTIANNVKNKAEWKCQKCGKQCRKPGDKFDTHKNTLTVAHLNHIPEDVREENLMAMCAPCHLRYDAKHHAETRRNKKEEVVEHDK